MADSKKRKSSQHADQPVKKVTGKKQWHTPQQKQDNHATQSRVIEPGDAGIWATCNMKKEGKCVAELRDCFEEYVSKLYDAGNAESAVGSGSGGHSNQEGSDIEAEISRELRSMRQSAKSTLYRHIKVDTNCVVFFKTLPPIDPVSMVHAICQDASTMLERKRSRFIKKLTPITLIGKATESGLNEVARQVLAPHFHGEANLGRKFAIRPNFRNHKVLTREGVINLVAAAVGPGHKVDLNNYDRLILVEVYKNVCGMSVVGNDYEQLKRFNLAEIFEQTTKQTDGHTQISEV